MRKMLEELPYVEVRAQIRERARDAIRELERSKAAVRALSSVSSEGEQAL